MTTTQQATPQVIGVGHVALSARDPATLSEFYRDVLGFQVVPTETSDLGESAFLSSHPVDASVDLVSSLTPLSSTPPSKSVRWRTSEPSMSVSSAEASK
jgi:hypothetical protein